MQSLLESKMKKNVRASSSKLYHIEYNCKGYHRYGTEHCTSYMINEDYLDKLIYNKLLAIKYKTVENYKFIEFDVEKWIKQISALNSKN